MKRRILTVALSLALVALLVTGASLAYFTDADEVENTFTIGNVDIELAEPAWVQNSKLVPNTEIPKDPTVTVKANSEDCYVRLLVTISPADKTDELIPLTEDTITTVFKGYDATNWLLKKNTKNNDNTRTYEFWYKAKVASSASDQPLDALFDALVVPANLDGDEIKALKDLTITVKAEAIQSAGTNGDMTMETAFAALDAE